MKSSFQRLPYKPSCRPWLRTTWAKRAASCGNRTWCGNALVVESVHLGRSFQSHTLGIPVLRCISKGPNPTTKNQNIRANDTLTRLSNCLMYPYLRPHIHLQFPLAFITHTNTPKYGNSSWRRQSSLRQSLIRKSYSEEKQHKSPSCPNVYIGYVGILTTPKQTKPVK